MDPRDIEAKVARMEALAPAQAPEVPPIPEGWEDEERPEVRHSWAIENKPDLAWTVGRVGELDSEIEDVERQRDAALERFMDRLTKREAVVLGPLQRLRAFFVYRIAEYAARERPRLITGKKKSCAMIQGVIGWRSKPGRLKVKDEKGAKDELKAWLERQPIGLGLYEIEVKPNLDALNTWYSAPLAEGEVRVIPPGMFWDAETESFYVKPEPIESALVKGTP